LIFSTFLQDWAKKLICSIFRGWHVVADNTDKNEMNRLLRLACLEDFPALEELIPSSARTLLPPYYSASQIEAAIGPIFGVDRQLIADGTFYVAEQDGVIVGCGGWSKRKSLYGGDAARAAEDGILNPDCDPARIRAFFIHPDWSRRGVGKALLEVCETAIVSAGFLNAELVATLGGEPLYLSCGYREVERCCVTGSGGITLPCVRMRKRLFYGTAS
jgi:N-acetylglutamate synthase-like GNAT family acetyltransferase